MSSADPLEAPAAMEPPSIPDQPVASRKSYRRKYRKIMVTFEEKMRESNHLFKEEQRISDIAQRLSEQTDQLLQLLLDLNSRPQVPKSLRYDLKTPGQALSLKPASEENVDEEEAHLKLRRARHQLQLGQISPAEYRVLEQDLLQSEEFAPSLSYSSLLASSAPPPAHLEKGEMNKERPIGFISAKDEEVYLQSLDAYLDGTASNSRSHAANNLGSRNAERTIEREREMQLKNPISVYNWLRKHQPQVFLQDNEPSTEKPTRATGSRSSARKSASKDALKQEPDLYDDDGIAMDIGSSSRGKRKRDNDGGYRPKGGNARGGKRRKEIKEESGRNKRTKKLSMDAR